MRTTTVIPPRALTAAQLRELRRDIEREQARFASPDAQHDRYADALRRMDLGTYGLCVKCQEPIPFERLAVMPETPFCITCRSYA